jgi:hypothetical protein
MLQLADRSNDLLAFLDLFLVIIGPRVFSRGSDVVYLVRESGDDLGEDGRPSAGYNTLMSQLAPSLEYVIAAYRFATVV